jgi:hypothetical protein
MSPQNLPAVDRVVRIVRELDRHHGVGKTGKEQKGAANA